MKIITFHLPYIFLLCQIFFIRMTSLFVFYIKTTYKSCHPHFKRCTGHSKLNHETLLYKVVINLRCPTPMKWVCHWRCSLKSTKKDIKYKKWKLDFKLHRPWVIPKEAFYTTLTSWMFNATIWNSTVFGPNIRLSKPSQTHDTFTTFHKKNNK